MADWFQRAAGAVVRPSARVLGVAVCSGALLLGGAVAASADPSAIAATRTQIQQLERDSARAAEQASGARLELQRSQERLTLFTRQATEARIELLGQQRALEAMARELYVNGGMSGAALSFTLEDPDRFLSDLDRLSQASNNQSSIVRKAREKALSLKSTTAAAEREQQRLVAATAALGQADAEAERRLAAARDALAALEEEERQRIAEIVRAEQERARVEAAALRIAQATAAQRAAEARSASSSAGATTPSAGATTPPAAGSAAVGGAVTGDRAAAVQKVIDFALSKVGGPYVWGGSGPVAYDCSGLTQAAWAQAGVSLTHYSGTQYKQTTPVSVADMQPGDLLFFWRIEQHVGMYIGDGKFVHAANSVDGIRIDSLAGYYEANIAAVSRPGV